VRTNSGYCKRLIEVDLPIRRISEHARREKSIRHGNISTLHLWWARRPLAACRAIVLASLWPDPGDPQCPPSFRRTAADQLRQLRDRCGGPARDWEDPLELRAGLLDFIADFSNWDLLNNRDYLDVSRNLVIAAHEALGDGASAQPVVVDPFAGGGAIPLEALRVGAYTFASDLNPVAVLLNKVLLEYVPKYGPRLAEEVKRWGELVGRAVERELSGFYPLRANGERPVAYLWARTVKCEGPKCGVQIPLLRSLLVAKRGRRSVALKLVPRPRQKEIAVQIVEDGAESSVGHGTIRQGAATCPLCGYTTKPDRVRAQIVDQRGGADSARMLCVVTSKPGHDGRHYYLPTRADIDAVSSAQAELRRRQAAFDGALSLVPDEPIPQERVWKNNPIRIHLYGITRWGDVYTARQALALSTFIKHVRAVSRSQARETDDREFATAVATCLALVPNRCADFWSSLTRWISTGEKIGQTFGRQALPIVWDFAEGNPFEDISGAFQRCLGYIVEVLARQAASVTTAGHVERSSACAHPLPDDFAHAVITDPPYYDAVPYANLSDYFYVWFRRSIGDLHPRLFSSSLTEKDDECVYNPVAPAPGGGVKDAAFFERTMCAAMTEARRITRPDGIGVVVFAHKSTAGWEAQLQGMIRAGWTITGSWPIDTERPGRLRALNSAVLGSSIHLVCRPRENSEGRLSDTIGDWRDILQQLPLRIRQWSLRLAEEGIVGADAIFACLGPALEIFSQHARVEKASGEVVTLHEYLEHVWAAVAEEALIVIFREADATGFEEDARLTAIWFWVLKAAANGRPDDEDDDQEGAGDPDDDTGRSGSAKPRGYSMDFDTARKLAQGLGVDLERLSRPGGIVTIRAMLRSSTT
jgi:putative DNA methylase